MNEVKKVHLGRQQFTISVEAYKELQTYLHAIEHQVGNKEVLKEIESRMAELLSERGITKDKVVLAEDVAFLKEQLGTPDDFTEGEEKTHGHQEAAVDGKRLYRDTKNGMLAGVAAGLAAYLNIDPLVVRLAFIVLTFASGAGVIIYVLLWLLAPEARTPSDRLAMHGMAVTVDNLKEAVSRADLPGAASRASRTFGRIVEKIAYVILGIIGGVLTVGAVCMALCASIATTYGFIHGFPISDKVAFPVNTEQYGMLVCAFVVLFSLAFLMLVAGLVLIKRRAVLKGWVLAAVISIFLVAGGLGTVFGFDVVPQVQKTYRSLKLQTTYSEPAFQNVNLSGKLTSYTFQPDSKYYITVNSFGDSTSLNDITHKVANGTLSVDTSGYNPDKNCNSFCLYSDNTLRVTIHAPSLSDVRVTGDSNSFDSTQAFSQNTMSLTASYGANVWMSGVDINMVSIDLSKNDGQQRVDLSNIQGDEGSDAALNFGSGSNNYNVYRAVSVAVTTGSTGCYGYSPMVTTYTGVGTVTLNGKPVNENMLQAKYDSNHTSALNCVMVGQDE